MKLYEAWRVAKDGQTVRRALPGCPTYTKGMDGFNESFLIDASADDWEIAKEKHQLTFTDVEFNGSIDDEFVGSIFKKREIKRPPLFTKIHLEWEEEHE